MAAALFEMVCGVTLNSKKYEANWPELARLKPRLRGLMEELSSLAEEDARAYDGVVAAMKSRKQAPGPDAEAGVQRALEYATDVPMKTMDRCLEVLRLGGRVAVLGARSAYSDIGVGILLADAGMKGAELNVAINLESATDDARRTSIKAKLAAQREEAGNLVSSSLAELGRKR